MESSPAAAAIKNELLILLVMAIETPAHESSFEAPAAARLRWYYASGYRAVLAKSEAHLCAAKGQVLSNIIDSPHRIKSCTPESAIRVVLRSN